MVVLLTPIVLMVVGIPGAIFIYTTNDIILIDPVVPKMALTNFLAMLCTMPLPLPPFFRGRMRFVAPHQKR